MIAKKGWACAFADLSENDTEFPEGWEPLELKLEHIKAGSFITKDGKIIFIGGPGSGGGTAGSGGTPVTAANADELAQGMTDTELRDSLSRVKLEAGQLARERETFQQAFDKLGSRSINEAQARNWVSTYPVKVQVGRELEDIGVHLNVVKDRIVGLTPIYQALHGESVFRMRGGRQ